MRDLNKVADAIVSLYDGRERRDMSKEQIFKEIVGFIQTGDFTEEEKRALELFNIECFEA